jgi:signal transduction histidine kinase
MRSIDQQKDEKDLALDKAAQLEGMVRDLKIFSIGISHDLRAPVRAIVGFSQALLEDHSASLDDTGKAYLARINAAGRRMDQLIQDALVFGQTTEQSFVLSPVDVRHLVREVTELHPAFGQAHAEILFGPMMPSVMAHESALFQCVSNLLSNAVKFVPEGVRPQITITGSLDNGRVRICFRDNGIGISTSDQNQIFNLFHRVSHDSEGTGIGLAIVKSAVEKMDGTVGVDSVLGQGSTFWMEFAPVSSSRDFPAY